MRRSSAWRKTLGGALVGAMLFGPAAGAGSPVTYVSGGERLFSFEAPDDWVLRTGFEATAAEMPEGAFPAPRIVSLMPERPEGVLWVGLWAPRRLVDIDEAAEWIERLPGGLLSEPKIERSRVDTVNGLRRRVYSGAGTADGRTMQFDLALVQIAPGRTAAAAFIGEGAARAAHGAAIAAILASLRAAP